MQNRYAGDIGDYVKFALLRAISPGMRLGVAWYLYPDEDHNSDGRHTHYLDDPGRWRHLDPVLFDALSKVRSQRSVRAIEATGVLDGAKFSGDALSTEGLAANQRSLFRADWFSRLEGELRGCDLIFADPDNGLIDDAIARRRQRKFGKQVPLGEALALSAGKQAVIYHHNTRFRGGHDLEVAHWQRQLGKGTLAVRANAYSCRTFFVVNATSQVRERVIGFCDRWSNHRVQYGSPVC